MSEHKHLKLSRNRIQRGRPQFVRRWHRRLGLLSALAVFLLSITGLMLNHISQVYSSNNYVSAQWMLDWYDVPAPSDVLSYQGSNSPSLIWADGTILVNQKPIFFNQAEFLGVYDYKKLLHLFTATDLHLFTRSGEFVESVKLADAPPIESAYPTTSKNTVVLHTMGRVFDLGLDDLLINERANPATDSSFNSEKNFQSLASKLKKHSPLDAESISARQNKLLKSTVLLDLHSGRFFGSWGVWLMDFFAICFLLLAISGIVAWRRSLGRA